MALTNIEICSRALIRLGANPIAEFNDGSAESEVAYALYGSTKNALLSSYPWSFSTRQISLVQANNSPIADFKYAYNLPIDILRSISCGSGNRGRGIEFKILNGVLHTNYSDVILTYIAEIDEIDFPAFFTAALITKLAAEFSIPVTESTSRTEMLYNLAEKEIEKARLVDAQQDTPNRIENFNLIDVRG